MKKILAAAAAFTLIFTVQSCSYGEHTEISQPAETTVLTSASETSASVTSVTTTVTSTAVHTTSVSTTTVSFTLPETSAETAPPVDGPDYDEVELSMLGNAGNPDYHAEAAIPYVAWTEINLDKTMYAASKCIGYEFAMPDAKKKII